MEKSRRMELKTEDYIVRLLLIDLFIMIISIPTLLIELALFQTFYSLFAFVISFVMIFVIYLLGKLIWKQ